MHDKPVTTAIYLLVGLLLAFAPIMGQLLPSFLGRTSPTAAGAAPARLKLWGWGCALGVLLGLTLPWWQKYNLDLTLSDAALVVVYVLITAACLHILGREAQAPDTAPIARAPRWTMLALAGVIFVTLAFGTGMMESGYFLFTGWHHWGAYIASAEIMRAGGRIFYDFPTQYGLGPTTLLAAACGWNCWAGMYWLVGVVTVGLGAALLLPLFGLARTGAGLAVTMLAVTVAVLLWASGPSLGTTPTVMPSTGGMRFLPAAALAAVLWWSESWGPLRKSWVAVGFVLFAIGVLWSPESLFMCLAVWGPYYCLRRMAAADADRRAVILMWSLAHIALALLAITAVFVGLYAALYGVLPKPRVYLIYMLFPPGTLPINWLGPVWFAIVGLLLGAWTGWRIYRREGATSAFRRNLLLLMLAYASLAYALGRSHDNNFINLAPYFALLLASVLTSRQSQGAAGVAAGMLSSLITLLILFNWSNWPTARLDFDSHHLTDAISFRSPQGRKILATDPQLHLDTLLAALDRVQKISPDPVEVIDAEYINLPGQRVWTSLHGAANYAFMPESMRVWFVTHAAKRFHQTGWLIIDSTMMTQWMPDYLTAYRVEQDIDFGAYHALRLTPKP